MLSFVKKAMLTGVGLAVMTKEKAQELGRELVKKGEVTEKEGNEFVEQLMKKAEEASRDLEQKVENNVNKVIAKLDLVTKKETDKLAEKIAALEKAISGKNQE